MQFYLKITAFILATLIVLSLLNNHLNDIKQESCKGTFIKNTSNAELSMCISN